MSNSTIEENRVNKALHNLNEFLNLAEWLGRIPSAKSEDKYERKLAFWLVHMKQAKQGKSTCIWHQEMEELAESRGYKGLFTEDPRRLKLFNFLGLKIGGYEVIGKVDIFSQYNQTQWKCLNEMGETILISGYRLMMVNRDKSFSILESSTSHISGRKIGTLGLICIHSFSSNEKTIWTCSREEDGVNIIQRIELPSLSSLTRYMSVVEGKSVDKISSPLLTFDIDDMTGQKIGRWTVVGLSGKASNKECMWDTVCDCGTVSVVAGGKLRSGKTLSCGCLRKLVSEKIVQETVTA